MSTTEGTSRGRLGRLAIVLGLASLLAGIAGVDPAGRQDWSEPFRGLIRGSALLGGGLSLLMGLVTGRRVAMALGVSAVLASVLIPGRLCCGPQSNDSTAIGSLRAINSSESTYSSSCGANGYAQSLQDLAKPPAHEVPGFIPPDLATNGVIKAGYIFTLGPDTGAVRVTLAAATCNAAAADAISAYFAEAHPVVVGKTGQRSFATDARGTIYVNDTGAVIQPGMAGASVLQ